MSMLKKTQAWVVERILSTIVLPNTGWEKHSAEANEARENISEAVGSLFQEINSHYK